MMLSSNLSSWVIYWVVALSAVLIAFVLWVLWASSGRLKSDQYLKVTPAVGVSLEPRQRSQSSPTSTFRLLSYNMGYASGEANNERLITKQETLKNLSAIRKYVFDQRCDFVTLQEVDYQSYRSGYLNQADFISDPEFPFVAAAVSWDKNYVPYPYWPPQTHFRRILGGQATLSKFPIEKATRSILEKPKENPFWRNAFYLDRLALITQIKIGAQHIILVNVHLEAFIVAARERQAQALRELLDPWKEFPLIVSGDFNTEGEEKTLSYLTEGGFLRNAASTLKATFPSWSPQLCLDHVLVNEKIDVVSCGPVKIPGDPSDHDPVFAEFRVLGREPS